MCAYSAALEKKKGISTGGSRTANGHKQDGTGTPGVSNGIFMINENNYHVNGEKKGKPVRRTTSSPSGDGIGRKKRRRAWHHGRNILSCDVEAISSICCRYRQWAEYTSRPSTATQSPTHWWWTGVLISFVQRRRNVAYTCHAGGVKPLLCTKWRLYSISKSTICANLAYTRHTQHTHTHALSYHRARCTTWAHAHAARRGHARHAGKRVHRAQIAWWRRTPL